MAGGGRTKCCGGSSEKLLDGSCVYGGLPGEMPRLPATISRYYGV